MLSFFRTNQILASSLLILYAAVLYLSVLYIPYSWEPQGYGLFTDLVYHWIGYQSVGAHVLAMVLVVVQGITANVIDFSNKLSREQTLFPGLFLVLLSALSPIFLHLTPYHLANTFLLFAVVELMHVYRNSKSAGHIYNAGFYLGIAFMFVPAYWVFIFFLFAGLNILRSFEFKERLMVLSGFLTVLILAGTGYFWFDRWPEFVAGQFSELKVFLAFGQISLFGIIHLVVLGIILVVVLLQQSKLQQKRIMQAQKKIDILYWMLLLGGISTFFHSGVDESHAMVIIPALGMLTGMQVATLPKRPAELLHFFLFVTALFFQYRVLIGI